MKTHLALLDFCNVLPGESIADSVARSVDFAQRAEKLGFSRVWYTEHHNMPSIASSTPAVLIAHVAAHTSTIRLGSGGIMLPNHVPYTVAEQFGMLAELHPDRIDLGVGRAPGTDQQTLGRALRRDPMSAERFPDDVAELRAWLSDQSPLPGVEAIPGKGTNVPVIILGSSMFGATLAAKLGLPYSFASHFAPTQLEQATTYYRENYQPSELYPEPHLIAATNVIAADTHEDAERQQQVVLRRRLKNVLGRQARDFNDSQLDAVLNSPQGQQMAGMLRYTAVGTANEVAEYLQWFTEYAGADELMISLQNGTDAEVLNGLEILGQRWNG